MRYKTFGDTPLQVSEIGFGCARLGGFLQHESRSDIQDLLRQSLDAGITFYDTSDMYCQGESERLLGAAFRRDRDRVVIASKGGYVLPAQRRAAATIKPFLKSVAGRLGIQRRHLPSGLTGALSQNFTPAYLANAVEASLKRLNTDHLDLYQLHSPPAPVLESGDFIEVLDALKAQGKIRCYGVSCETVEDALLCLRHPGLSSLQIGVGLLDPEALQRAIPEASARGVAVIARGCFGGGLLKPEPDLEKLKAETPKWPTIVACRRLADQNNRPLLELALQYILSAQSVTTTLLGMRTAGHLTENLRYASAARLSPAESEALRALLADGALAQ